MEKFNFIIRSLGIIVLIGCSSSLSDEEAKKMVEKFWKAVVAGDKEMVKECVPNGTDLSLLTPLESNQVEVKIGKLNRNNSDTLVDTVLIDAEGREVSLQTPLLDQDGKWVVDYEKSVEAFITAAFGAFDSSGFSGETDFGLNIFGEAKEAKSAVVVLLNFTVEGNIHFQGKELLLKEAVLESWDPEEKSLDLTLFPFELKDKDMDHYQSQPEVGGVFIAWEKESPNLKLWKGWSPFIGLTITFSQDGEDFSKDNIDLIILHLHWWDKPNESKSFSIRGDEAIALIRHLEFSPDDFQPLSFLLKNDKQSDWNEGMNCEIQIIQPLSRNVSKISGSESETNTKSSRSHIARQQLKVEFAKQSKFNTEEAKQKLILEKYKIDLNTMSTKLNTVKKIDEASQKAAMDEASALYSSSKRREVIKKAEEKFPLFHQGDHVDLQTRQRQFSGILNIISLNKLKVGSYYILKEDILSPDPACFDEVQCKKRRDHFVRVNFDIPRDDFIQQRKKELKKTFYKENGWIFLNRKWVHIDTLVEKEILPQVRKLEAKYNTKILKETRQLVEERIDKEGLNVAK